MIHFDMLSSYQNTLSPSFFAGKKDFVNLQSSQGKLLFHAFVQNNFTADKESYAYSLGYYLITGRRGAWIYGDESFIFIACCHPNLDNEFLFFAPNYNEEKISFVAKSMGFETLKISRASTEIQSGSASTQGEEETVMDWIYPSHTFSTSQIQSLEGSKYSRIRWELTKFKDSSIKFVPDMAQNSPSLFGLLKKQAKNLAKTQTLSEQEILNSLIEGIQVYEKNKDCMNIGVFYKDNVPFGLVIWDKTLSSHANLLWLIQDVSISSIGYCIYQRFGCFLQDQGIQYFNAGGSETRGLNDFKMKFRPVQSFACSNAVLSNMNSINAAA